MVVVATKQSEVLQAGQPALDPFDDVVAFAPFRWVSSRRNEQPRSRAINARVWFVVATRRVRPWSRTAPDFESTVGMMSAAFAIFSNWPVGIRVPAESSRSPSGKGDPRG